MANQFLNAQEYANSMLLLLKNQLVYGKLVDGQFKDQVTDQNGLTVNVKRPPRFIATSGATLQAQDVITGTAPVTVDQYKNVHIALGDLEYVANFNALLRNETMKSAAVTLAHDVDKFIAGLTTKFHSWVAGSATLGGANATDPTKKIASPSQAMAGHTRLMSQGVPNTTMSGLVDFTDAELIRGSLVGSNIQGVNLTALERVKIPMISEIDWYATQQNISITTGTRAQTGAAQVNGNAQNVNYRSVKGSAGTAGMTQTLAVNNMTAGHTVKAGEVFTIANVFAWDWRNQTILEYLQQFTVLADATADGGGAIAALSISPAIIVQGTNDGVDTKANSAFGTVSVAPVTAAAISWAGAASTVLRIKPVFHKRAISLVSARLAMPFTGTASFAVDPGTGIAIRYWRGSDITSGVHAHRWDMIYGGTVMDPFLGTRLCGT